MHISTNVRTLCSRVHTLIRQRRHKEKRSMQIVRYSRDVPHHSPMLTKPCLQSAPFNLKREPVLLPGISEDE